MTLRRILTLSLPAVAIAGLLSMALVETWVRLQWDPTRGTPGFFVSDPALGLRLNPGYDGWFAGAPVKINSLGFRDDREYSLEKRPGTFRILVLGDSVTFGHGALYETTYPYLVEQRLKAWRPDVDWEVWNLGVPGYNTSQELAYLTQVGSRYRPDLVIVGFFANDLTGNEPPTEPTRLRRAASWAQRTMQQRLYSYEFYKRVYLTARWRLLTSETDRRRLEHVDEEATLVRAGSVAGLPEQRLSEVDRLDDKQVRDFVCIGSGDASGPEATLRSRYEARAPEFEAWLLPVRAFQRLHRDGVYRVMFFVNLAPQPCWKADRFYDSGALDDDALMREILGDGTPVASSAREFLHYRPSQMPGASGHSMGNANRVKADVLFEFLRTSTLLPEGRLK